MSYLNWFRDNWFEFSLATVVISYIAHLIATQWGLV